jgi:biopolymer transport protein ExbB/TolQ
MEIAELTQFVGMIIYIGLVLIALWGAYCCVIVWQRVAQKRFKSESAQDDFLDLLEPPLGKKQFDQAAEVCETDQRAVPQLAHLAVLNRRLGFAKARQLVEDRLQRDILGDFEHRLTWVHTVIKSAPMVGLFGTVTGMMGAFGKLAANENVKPDILAEDISFALITTAAGLAIAIPLIIAVAAVNIRIRKMEELTVAGLNRFLEMLQNAMSSER